MSRRPLYIALFCALALSCLATLCMVSFTYADTHQLPHPEWLESVIVAMCLPGAFVSMMLFGMCNGDNLQGWTVTIVLNAVLYAFPLTLYASMYELRHRKKMEPPAAPEAALKPDTQR